MNVLGEIRVEMRIFGTSGSGVGGRQDMRSEVEKVQTCEGDIHRCPSMVVWEFDLG